MDGMDLTSVMSANSLTNSFVDKFRTGNVAVDYMINFVFLAVFGWLTTSVMPRLRSWANQQKWPCQRHRLRPQLRFSAKKSNSSWRTGVIASVEYRAWLGKIREVIEESGSADGGVRKKTVSGLYQLQEFTASASIYDMDDREKTNIDETKKSEWMPDQEDAFVVYHGTGDDFLNSGAGTRVGIEKDDSSTTKDKKKRDGISGLKPSKRKFKIYCEFGTSTEEGRGDNPERLEHYTLTIYTESRQHCAYLLAFHQSLMRQYYLKAKLSLQSKPHIFELMGVDSETKEIEWDQNPFSSTRQLSHVWFKQKKTFLAAYNNFMDNRADYERRGDPWLFSGLCYGSPGCGKTSLLKALVNDGVNRGRMTHVFVISFSRVKDTTMFSRVMFNREINGHYIPFEQRMIIFEDFDCGANAKVFKRRFEDVPVDGGGGVGGSGVPMPPKLERGASNPNHKLLEEIANQITASSSDKVSSSDTKDSSPIGPLFKEKKDDELTLSGVLNVLDGINERTGQRCFWTTNASPPEEHFDAAFLRPGRMDMIIDFTRCNHGGIKYLVGVYYEDDNIDDALVELVEEYLWSPAEVKQRCKECSTAEEALRMLIEKHPMVHV